MPYRRFLFVVHFTSHYSLPKLLVSIKVISLQNSKLITMSGSGQSRKYRLQQSSSGNKRNEGTNIPQLPHAIFPPNNSGYGSDQDEGLTGLDWHPTPARIPAGATLQTALRRYRQCETGWKDSKAYKELKNIFVSRILKQNGRTTKCICFGLGSPTERDPDNASMYQLAAFTSVMDLLAARPRQPPTALAQEPCFNTLDRELLSHLNISVVNHPAAFQHIDRSSTFVFCPYVDPAVLHQVVSRSPAIYLGWHPLETEPCYEVKVLMAELRSKRREVLRLPAFEPIVKPRRTIFDEMSIFWTSSH